MVEEHAGALTVGGLPRTFHVVAPDTPVAVLLVLHGSDSDAAGLRELSGHTFDHLVRRSVLVVYPEAVGGVWNDARLGTRSQARERGVDDVGFLSRLVAHLTQEYDVPPDRVFAAGFSNGGQMVIRLILQRPDLLAGAAIIASNHPTPDNLLPEMAGLAVRQAVRVLTINGTEDPIVPFEGGEASLWGQQSRGTVLSSAASAALFARRNGITTPPVVETVTTGRLPTTVTSWREEGREPVGFYAIQGGGHTVPNTDHDAPVILGRTQRDLEAGELVADFFGLLAE